MTPLLAFCLGGLTACTLMRIAISIDRDIQDHRERHEREHERADRRTHGPKAAR